MAQRKQLAKAYVDGLFPDAECLRQKQLLHSELESLVVPRGYAAEAAGRLIKDLPALWDKANLGERRKLLVSMLDAVYVDARRTKSVLAVRPEAAFRSRLPGGSMPRRGQFPYR